jgi:phosphoribosylformylglycinamidine synthase
MTAPRESSGTAEVAAIPIDPISTEAPVYERPMQGPSSGAARHLLPARGAKDLDCTDTLYKLLASPNLSSKHWIVEQYDTTVRTNTIAGPERRDAAIVRVKGTGRALAISADVNPVYCFLDPYEGGKQAVAEAARNVAMSGGRPVAITDCPNFGPPERPEIMWQFAECIRGISEACLALGTPVVSATSRFYNETKAARSTRRRRWVWSASWNTKTSAATSPSPNPASTSSSSAKRAMS